MARSTWKTVHLFSVLSALWLLPTVVSALITGSEGNKPIPNMGWPTGSEAVANLPSRLRYMEGPPFGGGEYFFEYHCKDTAEFNSALKLFGAIRVPRTANRSLGTFGGETVRIVDEKPLLLVVHDGPKQESTLGGKPPASEESRVDWTFTVWAPENYHNLFSNPKGFFDSDHPNFRQPVPPPRIDVYVGGGGPIAWEKVEVPSNVRVIDRRAVARPPVADRGLIRGAVYDIATHRVIAGAEIVLAKRGERGALQETIRTKTDDNGAFEIKGIPKGYYQIHVRANGYAARNVGAFDNGDGYTCHELDALVARTAALRGRVTDKKGDPIAGVRVRAECTLGIDGLGYECADQPSTTTNAQGRFELRSVPEGFARVDCSAPTLHQETLMFDLHGVSARPWDKPEEITIVMTGTGVVRGKVVDASGKPPTRPFIAEIEPKGGARVGTWSGSMQCQKDGSFEFKGVPPGEYVVNTRPNPASDSDIGPPRPVPVTAGETVELEIVSHSAHKTASRR